MRAFGVVIFLAVFVSQAAVAQEQTPAADAMTILAERYITDAQASGIFVADVDANTPRPRVRHQESGLLCTLSDQFTAARLRVVESGATRGDEVVCSTSNEWVGQAIYLRKIASPLTPDEDMSQFQTEVIGSRADLRIDVAAPALAAGPGVDDRTVALGNGRVWSYLRVAHINGWSVRMRISSQRAAFELLSRQANRDWEAALRSMLAATSVP